MAIIHQKDKRSGITYAYESKSYWDKEKKQSRAKRTLIGRVDDTTKEIVPTDGRGRKNKTTTQISNKVGRPSIDKSKRSYYGATYFLDSIGKQLGIEDDLKRCFPDRYKQILSLAYYMILEDNSPLYRFEKWEQTHKHPYKKEISSQRSSELFASITEENKQQFFMLQGDRKKDKEFWAYDTTSISSYSQTLKQSQYGYNKEHDPLAQINLAIIFGQTSHLPFYYRKLAGNIPDSKTLGPLLADMDHLGFGKVKLVMDKGFYKKENIDALYDGHRKFLLSVPMSLKFIKESLNPIYDSIRSYENYDSNYELYSKTVQTKWNHTHKNGTLSDKRIYIHYYYNIEKAAQDEKNLDNKLMLLKQQIESGDTKQSNEALYEKYFTIHTTPKRGTKAIIKDDIVDKQKKQFGYFALISNESMDSITALQIYRNKDLVEKAFGNLKERLNMRRMLVSNEQSLEGKLFVQFVALIYLSHIKKQMKDHNLFKHYTLQTLLDKLDVIECFEYPGSSLRVGELLQKQIDIYNVFGIKPPS